MPPKSSARLRDGRAFTSLQLAAGLVVPVALFGGPVAIAVPVTAPPAAVPGPAAPGPAPSGPASSGPASSGPASSGPALSGAALSGAAAPGSVAVDADQRPSCGDPDADDFPIETRIHGGPDTYASGGGYGTWYLDLANTTSETCHAIHPVLVLTDEDRKLTSEQVQLEFTERTNPDQEHRVTWETTDRDEQIGVFGDGEADDDFPGFTVPAKRTVTVEVRLAFTSDTLPGNVTANAAIVQRRVAEDDQVEKGAKADGDWVGESAGYSFVIVDGAIEGSTETGDAEPDADSGTGTGDTTSRPDAPRTDAAGNTVPELARTGRAAAPLAGIAATAAMLVLGGLAIVLRTRRTRRGDH